MKKNLLIAIAIFCFTFAALIVTNNSSKKDVNKEYTIAD